MNLLSMRSPLSLLFVVALFVSCEHETSTPVNPILSENDLVYQAPKDICGEIIFQEKIGDTIRQSLDEIYRRKIMQGFERFFLETQKLQEVRDLKGQMIDRDFYVVIVKSEDTGLKVHAWHEVIDETGNLYVINWCPD